MEFGPRALGNRSILASPLNPYSTENLNVYIKHREPFRKFAASVPAELAAEYFEVGPERPLPRHRRPRAARAPASSSRAPSWASDLVRVHTVHARGEPALLATAARHRARPPACRCSTTPRFNLFGDPLVCTPRDAVRSFYSSGIDAMFVGNFLLEK